MDTYFEYKKTLKSVSFCYARKPVIDEREIHPYHEILYYLGGDATFICDAFSKKLSPHTLLLIPRESYHFFKLDDPKGFERLKISFTSLDGFDELLLHSFSSVQIFEKLDKNTEGLLHKLCEELKNNKKSSSREQAIAYGSLLILLSSLESSGPEENESDRSRMVSETIRHIEKNISGDLDTASISSALRVSSSTLSHVFTKEMGISLHKYVIQKRIAFAERLLSEGNNPTKIYEDCGFSDYSSFYKAYFKLTGHAPSHKER